MDIPGEPWVRTREGRVALPKGREGDMLHSQLVKLGQLQGRKEVRANQSNWVIIRGADNCNSEPILKITNITRDQFPSEGTLASRGSHQKVQSHLWLQSYH